MSAKPQHLHPRDAHGFARLATDATQEVTAVVEAMHAGMAWAPMFGGRNSSGRAGGLPGLAYASVHTVAGWVGKGVDLALPPLLDGLKPPESTPERNAWLSVLGGVVGDHLAATQNSLAIPMELHCGAAAFGLKIDEAIGDLPQASSKVAVFLHGLCGHEAQWQGREADYPALLSKEFGFTPLFLRYNSGRHVSENGQDLAALLEKLTATWPVAVDEIVLIGHSMGGLVARSAMHHAAAQDRSWLALLRKAAFLGSPHHGAPLERGGLWLQQLLGSLPFAAPLAALPRLRSSGITDLRHGNVAEEDWSGEDRFATGKDQRSIVALPPSVDAMAIAATTGEVRGGLRDRVVGDGLVPVASALGQHLDPERELGFATSRQHVLTQLHHMDLLGNRAVEPLLRVWLLT